jgi:hypothetical protein
MTRERSSLLGKEGGDEAIGTLADERLTTPMKSHRRRESDRPFENRSKAQAAGQKHALNKEPRL